MRNHHVYSVTSGLRPRHLRYDFLRYVPMLFLSGFDLVFTSGTSNPLRTGARGVFQRLPSLHTSNSHALPFEGMPPIQTAPEPAR